jgi:hypothetical protein
MGAENVLNIDRSPDRIETFPCAWGWRAPNQLQRPASRLGPAPPI